MIYRFPTGKLLVEWCSGVRGLRVTFLHDSFHTSVSFSHLAVFHLIVLQNISYILAFNNVREPSLQESEFRGKMLEKAAELRLNPAITFGDPICRPSPCFRER